MDNKTIHAQAKSLSNQEYEIIPIEKTKVSCGLCEDYSAKKSENKELTTIISCEGACLRGEVSRRTANKICYEEFPANTARVCLGGAFTKEAGQRNMVRTAKRSIVIEGCSIKCATRMMKGVIPEFNPGIIILDQYYSFNKNLFAANEVSEEELVQFANEAVTNIRELTKL